MFHKAKECNPEDVFPKTYQFSHFVVKFAYNQIVSLNHTKEGKKALILVDKWLKGKKVTNLNKAANVAADSGDYTAANVASAAYFACNNFCVYQAVNGIVYTSINREVDKKEIVEFFHQIALNFLCYQKQQWDFNQKQWKILLIQGLKDNDKDLVNIALRDFPEDEEFTTSFIKDIRRFYSTKEDIVTFMLKKKDEIILLLEEIF